MYLYTGGGIMPESIFNIKNPLLSISIPGYLPDIRGADCLLWSIMLAGYPSATSFFMNSQASILEILLKQFFYQRFLFQLHYLP